MAKKMGDDEDPKDSLTQVKNVFTDFKNELLQTLATNLDPETIKTKLVEVDIAATNIIKSFGLGRDSIVELKGAMTEVVTEVTLLGGNFDDIARIQKDVGETLGRNVKLSGDVYKDIVAAEKVTGKKISEILPGMKEVGISTSKVGKEMESVINSARAIGVNAKAVTDSVSANMSKLNQYNFQGGVEGLAKMAAHATSINMDMKSTFAFADKVFKPEGAIETAAALQRLGVTQSQLLDPLKLMDLSRNDPAELQKQMADLGKGFVELNEKGRFQIAPGQKERMMEIADAMGITYGELAKMSIGAASLDDKMKKISFPDIPEEQKQFIANMAEMNEKGEYTIRYQGKDVEVNELMKTFKGDKAALDKFIADQQPKKMEDLAKEQLNVQEHMEAHLAALANRTGYAVAGSELGEKQLDAVRMGRERVTDLFEGFDIKGIRNEYQVGMKGILDSLTTTLNGEGSIEDVLTSISNAAMGTKNFLEGGFQKMLTSAVETADLASKSKNEFVELINSTTRAAINSGAKSEKLSEGNVVSPGVNNSDNKIMNEGVNNTLNNTNSGNQGSNQNQGTMTVGDSNIKMNITLDAPSHIDTAQVQKILDDPLFRQNLEKAVREAYTNNGQTMYGNPNQKKSE